MLPILIKSF